MLPHVMHPARAYPGYNSGPGRADKTTEDYYRARYKVGQLFKRRNPASMFFKRVEYFPFPYMPVGGIIGALLVESVEQFLIVHGIIHDPCTAISTVCQSVLAGNSIACAPELISPLRPSGAVKNVTQWASVALDRIQAM